MGEGEGYPQSPPKSFRLRACFEVGVGVRSGAPGRVKPRVLCRVSPLARPNPLRILVNPFQNLEEWSRIMQDWSPFLQDAKPILEEWRPFLEDPEPIMQDLERIRRTKSDRIAEHQPERGELCRRMQTRNKLAEQGLQIFTADARSRMRQIGHGGIEFVVRWVGSVRIVNHRRASSGVERHAAKRCSFMLTSSYGNPKRSRSYGSGSPSLPLLRCLSQHGWIWSSNRANSGTAELQVSCDSLDGSAEPSERSTRCE